MRGAQPGSAYTRAGNPTIQHLAVKHATLDGIGILGANPQGDVESPVKAVPFAGGMAAISSGRLAFELKGGLPAAKRLLTNLRLAAIAASLGNFDTLIQPPAMMNYSGVAAEQRAHEDRRRPRSLFSRHRRRGGYTGRF